MIVEQNVSKFNDSLRANAVIRVGDKVRVINNRFIKRVGYALSCHDFIDDIFQDIAVANAYTKLSGDGTKHSKGFLSFCYAIALGKVRSANFGGRERKIHYFETRKDKAGLFWKCDTEIADYTGNVFEVLEKRVAKTGLYFPPSGGYDSYTGEDWSEPGGLSGGKTHVLLTTNAGVIERCDVEIVLRK